MDGPSHLLLPTVSLHFRGVSPRKLCGARRDIDNVLLHLSAADAMAASDFPLLPAAYWRNTTL